MQAKILVVDDHSGKFSAVLDWLREASHDLKVIDNAEGIVRHIEQHAAHLVLLGRRVGDSDGLELCQRLRENQTTRHVPVMIMTSDAEVDTEQFRQDALLAGANDVLCPPFQLIDIRNRIHAILFARNIGTGMTRRLLEESCQNATVILRGDLAWLLISEGQLMHSRLLISERGPSAAEVFLRIVTNNSPEHPSYPLVEGISPLSEAVLQRVPLVNIPIEQIRELPNGEALFRALTQLRLTYVHFLPLIAADQIIGMLVLAGQFEHDISTGRGVRIVQAVTRHCLTAVESARLQLDSTANEQHLEAEQAFRRMVLDTMGEGLVVIDDHQCIRYVNSRLLRLTGYTRQELYGNSVGVIFHPERRPALLASLERQARQTAGFGQQLITKNGRIVPVLLSRATLPDNNPNYKVVLVLSDLTEQKERELALEHQSEQLRGLNEAVQNITSALSQEDTIAAVLQSAFDIVNCLNSCIYLFDNRDAELLRVVAARGPMAEQIRSFSVRFGQGIAGRVAEEKTTLLIPFVRAQDYQQPLIEREGSSVIAVPLMVMDNVFGVLEVINRPEGFFQEDDAKILENLAAAASVAIENAQLFGQARRQVTELSMMLDASSAVSSTLDIGDILELITRRLVEAMNVARCSISAWERTSGELITLADACDAYWTPGDGPQHPLSDLPLMTAVLQREQPLVARASDSHADVRLREHIRKSGMAHLLLMPLSVANTVVGVVELYHAAENASFTVQQVNAVREGINQWRAQLRRTTEWYSQENLTDLYRFVYSHCIPNWTVISLWDKRSKSIRPMREIGFAVWRDMNGVAYRLDDYPTMLTSLTQGLPMTLLPALLFNDPHETQLMTRYGASTGLSIPLIVRGEASGMIKLMDVAGDRAFDSAEVSLCQAIANVVANALENARLFQSLEKRAAALQTAYDELREADRLKDELIQNLSHELKTPIMQALFELELIGGDAVSALNEDQRKGIQSVVNRISGIGSRVETMVALHASREMQFDAVDLTELVQNAVQIATGKASKSGLKIVPHVPHADLLVRADAGRLSDVLKELLDNAIKFTTNVTTATPPVEVNVDNGNGYMVKVTVRDHGIGIRPEEFDRIFQPGYQVDGSTGRRFAGTGMGLAVVRQIVEGHGGKIWVNSTLGSGSEFQFTIPKWRSEE